MSSASRFMTAAAGAPLIELHGRERSCVSGTRRGLPARLPTEALKVPVGGDPLPISICP
jgi:hypothetical protein